MPKGGVAQARATNCKMEEENSPTQKISIGRRQGANAGIINSPSSAFLRQMGYQQVRDREGSEV